MRVEIGDHIDFGGDGDPDCATVEALTETVVVLRFATSRLVPLPIVPLKQIVLVSGLSAP